jgi:2-polyprenyl-3-methyl-5-hydroxy-6-metoxy-1,4-benzoquinol methylase
MVTVDFPELKLKPQSVVLDAGCGTGRHLREMTRLPDLKIIGLDKNDQELHEAYASLQTILDAKIDNCLVMKADIRKLPFAAASFDFVICSEVLEHIAEHQEALTELVRVLKPQGIIVISVPRYYPERICWMISPAYHNTEGGHIRIYKKKRLAQMLAGHGIKCWKINYKHALHAPYWWLKCMVGLKNEDHWLVKYYKKFLEWDIMQKPVITRVLENLLNPILGKSIVFYLKKGDI